MAADFLPMGRLKDPTMLTQPIKTVQDKWRLLPVTTLITPPRIWCRLCCIVDTGRVRAPECVCWCCGAIVWLGAW